MMNRTFENVPGLPRDVPLPGLPNDVPLWGLLEDPLCGRDPGSFLRILGRPQSGTIINRPNSGTSSAGASPQTSRDKKSRTTKNHVESKIPKNNIDKTTTKGLGSRTSIDTKLDLKPLQNGPKKASGSQSDCSF
jgi:hypothetical protein